jgi:membrane associated rhomboid family serine protease
MRLSGRKASSFTKSWTHRQRIILVALVGFNVGAFVAQSVLEMYRPGFTREFLGLSAHGVQSAYAWQFFSSIFLHDGPWHLLGNMLLLSLIGRDVEVILGQKHFLFLYLAGAFGGELSHLFLMPQTAVLLGASGGVAAVLFAFATILPELELVSGFLGPLRLKAKHLAYAVVIAAAALLFFDRHGTLSHSAYLGGCAAGWIYAHLLGFGRASFLQRAIRQRRADAERHERMSAEKFISQEVDPLLEKISAQGLRSLTRSERRILAKAGEKMAGPARLS